MEKNERDVEIPMVQVDNDSDQTSSEMSGEKKKMQFSGQCSFLVTLVGYSMGTSDFWRFPYLVFRNGGGAFLIPFAIFMLIVGLPMLFFEISVSQFAGKGSLSMWDMAPYFKGIGYTFLAINIVNNIYYNILRGWMLEYFISSFRGSQVPWTGCNHTWNRPGCVDIGGGNVNVDVGVLSNDTYDTEMALSNVTENVTDVTKMTAAEQFWQYEVLQLSPGISYPGGILWNLVLFMFIYRLIVSLCMVKSIKSIEKVMFVTVFIPILLMLIIWVRALLLEGSVSGMLYYLTPKVDRLFDIKVWLEAALMACYTLGPGWGTIPVIGSHNRFNGDTIRHSVVSTIADVTSAFMNGLICFCVLGVMAHDSGLGIENTVSSGLSLGFTVYPTAFTYFPLPHVWSAVFFFNLLLVGLDAQMLSTETVMNCVEDISPKWFKGSRRVYMIALFNVVFFLLTLPFCTRGGMYIFQLVDWYAAAWTLLFVCFVESIVFTWVYGTDRLSKDVELMVGRPLPTFIRITGAFITPTIIFILLIISLSQYKPPSYGSYNYPYWAEIFGWSLAILIISPIFIYFIYKAVKTGCSPRKILEEMQIPRANWGPNDVLASEQYRGLRNQKSERRKLISTVKFSVTGKHTNPIRGN